ncbi:MULTISPECIES: signal recognition particle-docking protein FtsY [Sphaerobacter]|uniref:Signal recognition particle receptor FtsY n=1 Tax=Sphaerobacter thermophilus (strain ATCC 49802 / DSM 20745 / KCCM 41009 / NCIMB 13125 / S 6022) TaxID=479434 RepID=D1C723_SPHTD|nr:MULTISPECIES: signal recognition particle-docking protein FtsY [Sphaerobacter]ACZ37784.1 signal recognition particle-docking protein FtsY [Sphaerobacter thermophilus DSM 20745]MBX5444134.1 signal recognition particle-docking protein FtsY [Sphaerobacter sp.]PZN64136.1 MAG: signal recognition particle-docking protein FtsY [Sphaerobacter thermophilus]
MVFSRLFRRRAEPEPKIEAGLKKTRRGIFKDIANLFERSEITEDLFEDLEALLIQADLGVETTLELLDNLRDRIDRERIKQPADAREALRTEMIALLENATRNRKIKIYQRGVPFVILVVGVNGTGKTTTIAKLAKYHQDQGRNVMLVAGDTFRAAAIDQLKVWGERLKVPVIAHDPGADPGAVVFDGMQAAYNRNADILLVDTAGRLHTKYNLMEELKKIRKVMQRHVAEAPQEVLLVIDATTGQNGLVQAKKFAEAVEITDIAIAKLDGTARGGIAFAIARELGTPISYVGTGEQVTALAEFNPVTYVDALFFGEEEEL